MDIFWRLAERIDWNAVLSSTLRVLLILTMLWVGLAVVKRVLKRLQAHLTQRGERSGEVSPEAVKRADTLVRLVRQGVVILAWVMTVLVILKEIGVEIAPLLASAGIVGLAVGFGAQNLVRDVISGFFMILENQVRVGDVAVINGTGGLVEQINFRTIVLRDVNGVVHIFPNGTITSLANMTTEWSAYVVDIGVAYKEDLDQVIAVMRRVGAEMREDEKFGPLIIADMEVFGVEKFTDSAVIIRGRLKTLPIRQWDVGREYLRRIKYAFDAEGIEIPFPHQSVYFGSTSKPFLAQLVQKANDAQASRKDEPPARMQSTESQSIPNGD